MQGDGVKADGIPACGGVFGGDNVVDKAMDARGGADEFWLCEGRRNMDNGPTEGSPTIIRANSQALKGG